jgi:hypothetical protein
VTDEEALRSWPNLVEAARDADEATARRLLAAELRGRRRKVFVRRLQSRLNRTRALRERADLGVL